MNIIKLSASVRVFSLLILTALSVHAAPIFTTNFSSPDYTVGALSNPAWTITDAGSNTQWIAQEDSTNPSAPTSLSSGRQPLSPTGTQMLWLSPNTTNVSANQVALLNFSSTRVQEPFKLTMDIMASPTGGPGQSFVMHLAQSTNPTATTAPRIAFTSISPSAMSLDVWDNGTSITSVVSLPKNSWLRFELNVNASTARDGSYTVTVYSIDSTGAVTGTLYTSAALDYSLTGGFDSVRLLTNSSRTDYWVSEIAVVPEPKPLALLMGTGLAFLGYLRFFSGVRKA